MKNVFCSTEAAKPTILPPLILYAWVTWHLPASRSLNITWWSRPLSIFSFCALSLEQVILHHSSPFLPHAFSYSSLLLHFSHRLLLSFQGSTPFYLLPNIFLISPHPVFVRCPFTALLSALWCKGTYHNVWETSIFCSFLPLAQWFSTEGDFSPWGHLAMSGDIFDRHG